MRRLADFAFMLGDYRLAHGVYDTVRKDFQLEDKAVKYFAGTTVRQDRNSRIFPATHLKFIPNSILGNGRTLQSTFGHPLGFDREEHPV